MNRQDIQHLIEEVLSEMINEEAETENAKQIRKVKVRRFFIRLQNSWMHNLLKFSTPTEQIEAILYFAKIVGVPKSRVSGMIKGLRDIAKQSVKNKKR